MEALPNYGADYARRFRGIYPQLAKKNGVVLVPFLLDGVAGVPSLNQADGIHPTAEGQRKLAETVWKALQPLLTS
jgi:acyl-CoA thioesterase-1